jgi:hypothetical protein
MKIQIQKLGLTVITLTALVFGVSHALAQTTAFTYQGRLADNGSLPNYDMRFTLYDLPSGGSIVAGPITKTGPTTVALNGGLFTTTLDFGANFPGADRWLQIEISPPSANNWTPITARQQLTPSPYAITAGNIASAGTPLPDARLSANVALRAGGNNFTGNQTIMSGNVGIGTPSPISTLHLASSASAYLTLDCATTASEAGIRFKTPGADRWFAFMNDSTYDFQIQSPGAVSETDSSPRLRLPYSNKDVLLGLSGGNVGVGLPSPAARLHVSQSSSQLGTPDASWAFKAEETHNVTFPFPGYSVTKRVLLANAFSGLAGRFEGKVEITEGGISSSVTGESYGRAILGQANGGTSSFGGLFQYGTDGNNAAYLGGNGIAADFYGPIAVHGTATVSVLTITGGSDLAEPFALTSVNAAKGSLLVIDAEHPGKLQVSQHAYDTRVAGIVSGANGVKPGISLHQEGALEGGENVALSGRVYALADASFGAIRPGDLLTTSDTPGHCMKVTNYALAQGAIVGKAMSALKADKGMVLVLVTLQ